MASQIDNTFIKNIESLIEAKDDKSLLALLSEEHYADIAEIIAVDIALVAV